MELVSTASTIILASAPTVSLVPIVKFQNPNATKCHAGMEDLALIMMTLMVTLVIVRLVGLENIVRTLWIGVEILLVTMEPDVSKPGPVTDANVALDGLENCATSDKCLVKPRPS